MKLLVTGALGFIGSRFCAQAAYAGHAITALARPKQNLKTLPPGMLVYGHLPYDVPPHAWTGVDAVVHCAAVTTRQTHDEAHAVTVEGTRVLLDAAVQAGVKRFVFVSSQSAHADAVSAYGTSKLRAEELVRTSGLPHAIVRPGLVFGPGDAGLFRRMRDTVTRLPVLPLLGGGRAIVQAIEVGDLCEAILRCLALPDGESVELNLGDPEGVTLREFLQSVAVAATGRRKPELVIPLGPVKLAVGIAQAMHIPLPVTKDNLEGMEKVRRMDTAPSLEKLGMALRPFGDALADATSDTEPEAVLHMRARPARILLVGTGKIGIVHALNLLGREGATLCGACDLSPKAFRMYRSMGIRVPFCTDVNEAVERFAPDGAIVATPAAMHLPLAELLSEKDIPVLVEKPLSIVPSAGQDWLALRAAHPGAVIHSGYMAAQYPHLEYARQLLEGGSLGRVRGVWAFSLQAHIMASHPVRWEMEKAKSGGGALLNFGSHVLSMLMRLFGEPISFDARMWPIHSSQVEDAIETRLAWPGFEGRFMASWSVPGYSRPDNRIVVVTDTARLVVNNAGVFVEKEGHTVEARTQRDFDIGYNTAPDYTGAGFSCELENFLAAISARGGAAARPVRTDVPPPVELAEAVRLEDTIFRIYDAAGLQDFRQPKLSLPGPPADLAPEDAEMHTLLGRLAR